MIEKVKQQYFEIGFGLMSGIIVDKELKDKLEAVLMEAHGKMLQLLDNNKEHLKVTHSGLVYPHGKQTSFSYEEPARMFDIGYDGCKELLTKALAMKPVEHLIVTDERMTIDKIKAFAQRAIEDELDGKDGGHE